jgi:hypothetical protein
MRTYRSLVILSILAATASAGAVDAAWVRQYSGVTQSQYNQAADSYLDTLTGNLYVVGSGELAANPGGLDLFVAKYRSDGTLVWTNGFSGSGPSTDDMAQSVAVDSIGNVYIAGVTDNTGPQYYDAAWAKYDSNGIEIWHKTSTWSGDDAAYGIAIGNAGDVYICGADSGDGFLTGYMVARIDPLDGDTIWKRSYVLDTNALKRSAPGRDLHPDYFSDYDFWDNVASSIAASPDGGIVTTGHGSDNNRYFEWWTMKFSASGTQFWAATYHQPNTVYDDDDVAFDVAVARNGDIYAVGFDYFETDANYDGYNYAVVRYSSIGARLNWRSINVAAEDGDDYAFSVCLDDSVSQNVYVTGVLAYPSPAFEEISTAKFSASLVSRWGAAGAVFGSTGDDRGYSAFYRKGRVYVTGAYGTDLVALGYTAANASPKDTLWSYTYDSPDALEDFGATICASDSDHVYVSGQSYRSGTPFWTSLYTARLRYGQPDLAVTSILAPQGQYDHYDPVTPRAVVTNYGNVASKFNAFMYIGLPYGDTVQVTSAVAPGESVVVEFRLWQAEPTGLVPVRCSLETPGDINPGNDFLTDTVEVRTIDVGCRLIVSPVGPVDSGTTVMPVARFKNYSLSPHTFPVWFRIEAAGRAAARWPGGPVKKGTADTRTPLSVTGPLDHRTTGPLLQVYEDSTTITLAAQESMDVSFDLWQATPLDTYRMDAFTTLFGDDNLANDTVSAQLVVRRPIHDVGVFAILAPADTIDTGAVLVPRALIRNFGSAQESFRIRFTIGSFFTSETSMTLLAGMSDTAEFASWTANQVGVHVARCSTMLAGDIDPINDRQQKQVVVIPAQGIESPDNLSGIPREFALGSPRPNPFTGRMLVPYALPTQSVVSLRIYDAAGALVRTLTSAELAAGFHHAVWNGTNERGQRVQPGTYFCRFQTPGYTRIAKLIMSD